jgi:hypothetical protein
VLEHSPWMPHRRRLNHGAAGSYKLLTSDLFAAADRRPQGRYPPSVARERPLSSRGAQKLGERERLIGLDPDDDAARWLEEHHPKPEPPVPKSVGKSKALHRWRQRQSGR